MDLTVDQGALSRALRLVARVAPMRPTLPILQMVLLAGELGLAAPHGHRRRAGHDHGRPGRMSRPRAGWPSPPDCSASTWRSCPPEPVRLTLEPARHRVRAACGSFVANLATADPDEFPALPTAEERSADDLDAGRLRARSSGSPSPRPADESRRRALGRALRLRRRGPHAGGRRRFPSGPHAAPGGRRRRRSSSSCRRGPSPSTPAPGRRRGGAACSSRPTAAACCWPRARPPCTPVSSRAASRTIERVIPQEGRTRVTVDTAAFRQAVRVAGLFGSGDVRPVLLEAMPDRLARDGARRRDRRGGERAPRHAGRRAAGGLPQYPSARGSP